MRGRQRCIPTAFLALAACCSIELTTRGADKEDFKLTNSTRDTIAKLRLPDGPKDRSPEVAAYGFESGTVVLKGWVRSRENKAKVLEAVKGVKGVQKVDAAELWWPAVDFDVSVKSELSEGERAKLTEAARRHYLDGDERAASTHAEGKPDGTVPYRVIVERTSTVTFGAALEGSTFTGTIVEKANGTKVMVPGKTVVITDKDKVLGPGYEVAYRLSVREKGSIQYTFAKWDGTKYKPLNTTKLPVDFSQKVLVYSSGFVLSDKVPKETPASPLEMDQARLKALAAVQLPALNDKVTAKFVDTPDKFIQRLKAAKGREERVPVDIDVQNTGPRPIGTASFEVTPGSLLGKAVFDPPLLPGEKRKVAATVERSAGAINWERWNVDHGPTLGKRPFVIEKPAGRSSFKGLGED